MAQLLLDIALPVPIDHTFTYLLPPHLRSKALAGQRVLVSFGKKHLAGVIVGFPTETQVRGLKPISDIIDLQPTFSPEMLDLTRWISEYYLAPWGEVLKSATPQGLSQGSKRIVTLNEGILDKALEATARAKKQHQILLALQKGPLTLPQLQKKTDASGKYSILHEMVERGWVTIKEDIAAPKAKVKSETVVEPLNDIEKRLSELTAKLSSRQNEVMQFVRGLQSPLAAREVLKKMKATTSFLKALEAKGLLRLSRREVLRAEEFAGIEPPQSITLNAHQSDALQTVVRALDSSVYRTFLLHGITGSGKTQVYIEAIKDVLGRGKTAIVLVPEISLTPQTVRRFRSHFGSDVAVMHSQMSVGERYDAWRMAREGKVRIIIGPRSAIFAPLSNLGLIVVDEEHESSYKQYDQSPRYNARDVAIMRATLHKALVLLGSATPSVESYYNALQGKYVLLNLPERVDQAHLPRIDVVNMAEERRRVFAETKAAVQQQRSAFPKHLPPSSISKLLHDQIQERLVRHEGVIILQNRRGFSHVVECHECGYVERCDNCDVTMTYHAAKKHLRCHYCGLVKKPPVQCPNCGGKEIRFHAFGTQQVHEELEHMFPGATTLRMDLDTTNRKGAHDRLLQQFGSGEADILLGTQMVAKGLDFPRVTLVGVISADTQMLLPDFRSSERTFQLLTQVAGRSGRSNLAGEVVIQTLQPDHYSLKHVVSHDFAGFYQEELAYRRELDYPPFSRIVLIEFKGKDENGVHRHARTFAELLRKEQNDSAFVVLGPADAAIPRIKNQYRKLVVVKSIRSKDPNGTMFRKGLQKAGKEYDSSFRKKSGVTVTVDVDPQGMM